jgi:hypothetical protein
MVIRDFGGEAMDTAKYAEGYISRGMAVIPVPPKKKSPVRPGWQNLHISAGDAPSYFSGGPQNIGVLLGEPSGGLVDVDLDTPEATEIAGHFLPRTIRSGHASAPYSHWWFHAPGVATTRWRDTDGEMILEMRSTGTQTIVPPSLHPNGEPYKWYTVGKQGFADILAEDLAEACKKLATATLIARHLPTSGRHHFALALVGYLLRPGRLDEESVREIVLAAWHAAKADSGEAVRDLERIIQGTPRNLKAGREVMGGPAIDEVAPGMHRLLSRWWQWQTVTRYGRTASVSLRDGHEGGKQTTPTTPSTPILKPSVAAEFPVDALPTFTRRFVKEAATAIGCPPELVAVPLLGTLSAGIGASRVVQLKRDWSESATLFLAVVASPGSRKTPASKIAIKPVWERQSELKAKYREERKDYEAEYSRWEAKRRECTKTEPLPEPPKEPTMGRTVVSDTTVEALHPILETNPRGVLVARDELAGWVRSMDQYKGGKGSDRQFWLSAWSNDQVAVDRKNKGEPTIIEKPWLSVIGSIQPDVLTELAAGREDGLLDRFLFAYPDPHWSRLGDDDISSEASDQVKHLYDKLASLELQVGENGEPVPGVVPMSQDAWEVYKELANELQDEMCAPGFPVRLEGVWSKMQAYLARLSLILALCRVAAYGSAEQVEDKDLVLAWGLVGYFKAHARLVHNRLYGVDPLDVLAEELAALLKDLGGEWKGEPSSLWQALKDRGSEVLPDRPDELSKQILVLTSRCMWFVRGPKKYGKRADGSSCRVLHLLLKNGVDGAVGVDSVAA